MNPNNSNLLSNHNHAIYNYNLPGVDTDNRTRTVNEKIQIAQREEQRIPAPGTRLPVTNVDYSNVYQYNNNNNNNNNDQHTTDAPTRTPHNRMYDPLVDFYYKNGLVPQHMQMKQDVFPVDINSQNRVTEPAILTDLTYSLPINPFNFDGDTLVVNMGMNHSLNVGDKVMIQGLNYLKQTIYSYVPTQLNNVTTNKYSTDFVESLDTQTITYLRFDINPNMDVTAINNLPISTYNMNTAFLNNDDAYDNNTYKQYDLYFTDLTVIINGFQSVDINATEIDNIKLNNINGKQRLYLAPRSTITNSNFAPLGAKVIGITDTNVWSDNATTTSIYIMLNNAFTGDFSTVGSFAVSLTLNHYGGIPINMINAGYPVGQDQVNGYQLISAITDTTVSITLPRNGYFNGNFGGSGVVLSRISNSNLGYSSASQYRIILDKVYTNIIQAELKGCIFPNTDKVIKDNTYPNPNNKLYWQNFDDGNTIYSITIPAGNYDITSLGNILEQQINLVKRVQSTTNGGLINRYTNNTYIQVDINTKTNIVIFRNYKEAILSQPIVSVSPNIPATGLGNSTGDYTLTFRHENHGIPVGTIILIQGAIDNLGIPAGNINGQQTISAVPDANSYQIQITGVNLNISRTNSGGGVAVYVYVPNLFKMRFDYTDTMGTLLGFRNAGLPTSITPYTVAVSNADPYDGEIAKDISGTTITLTNNAINLSGYDYFIMVINELQGYNITAPISKINNTVLGPFAKINLTGAPDTKLFDTFVPMKFFYYHPIKSISEFNISFYTPDGNTYNFEGLDHSFVLELTCLNNIPEGTEIATRI